MKRCICIVQARMGSSRLPGKVLKKICGKEILLHVVDRLKKCKELDDIIVATSDLEQDNAIQRLCELNNVKCFRGSEKDVLNRYYKANEKYRGDIVVRVTSDCPLIHPELVDKVICFFKENNYDYVSPRSRDGLIRGLDVEVFSKVALDMANEKAIDSLSREHVTYYFYSNPNRFKTFGYKFNEEYKDDNSIRLCVDEEKDYELVRYLYEELYDNNYVDIHMALKLLRGNERIKNINSCVKQKRV